jgi:hypothetical protein
MMDKVALHRRKMSSILKQLTAREYSIAIPKNESIKSYDT